LRDRLGLNDGPRSRVIGLPSSEFGHCRPDVARLPPEPSGAVAEVEAGATSGFDRLARP
jgi:hypothetical protein